GRRWGGRRGVGVPVYSAAIFNGAVVIALTLQIRPRPVVSTPGRGASGGGGPGMDPLESAFDAGGARTRTVPGADAGRTGTVSDRLIVRGAREHNLRGVDLDLPRDSMIVFTGLSGSGKSSLAFDTIFAEGQRRYVESLSAYARQFLGQMDKPDVDFIEGLSPAVSIDQKATNRNPRSTVGTITEVHDYL